MCTYSLDHITPSILKYLTFYQLMYSKQGYMLICE